jgi:hypothetical protein
MRQAITGLTPNQVLAEGKGEGEQHLGPQGLPEAAGLGEGFPHQEASKYQGEKDQGEAIPKVNHGRWHQGPGPLGTEQQTNDPGQEGFRDAPAMHPESSAEDGPRQQQQGQPHRRQTPHNGIQPSPQIGGAHDPRPR